MLLSVKWGLKGRMGNWLKNGNEKVEREDSFWMFWSCLMRGCVCERKVSVTKQELKLGKCASSALAIVEGGDV